jgi:hypothetical protein
VAAGDLTTLANLKAYLGLLPTWAVATAYSVGDKVRANNAQYACITAGTSAATGSGPSGTTADITDNTAHWKYEAAALGGDDATLSRLISAVSATFAGYCDRAFASGAHTYTVSGKGGTSQPLPEYPITAITSVAVGTTTIGARASVGAPGYDYDDDVVYLDGGYTFECGIRNVAIAYTAGYATTPADLEQACIETCASWYRRKSRTDEKSKSVGAGSGEVISFAMDDVPTAAKTILKLYSRPWPR